jgi:uncharacterized protein YndB with AHSA1/START domain
MDEGGDAACWLDRICDRCGGFIDAGAPHRCRDARVERVSTTRITRHIDAPPTRVYGALTDAQSVQQWMVPDGMTSEVHSFEAREGGAFRVSLTYEASTGAGKTSDRTDSYHGRFVRLVPDQQVVQTMEFESDDPAMQGEMTITYALADAAGGTDLVAVHEGVPSGVAPADNELGWTISIGKLAQLVEGPSPQVD